MIAASKRTAATIALTVVVSIAVLAGFLFLSTHTRPNRIVLVTLDTLRVDHLGTFGYWRTTSPFIDWLATEGVLFENAYSPMATTVPAHASMFTGLYPLQHGVLKNGQVLGTSVLTLGEVLSEAGYQTAGFVSTNRHFKAANLHQGFSRFEEPSEASEAYQSAEVTVEKAIQWLPEVDGKDFFLWVHLFDPHSPYRSPNSFPDRDRAEEQRLIRLAMERHRLEPSFFEELGNLTGLVGPLSLEPGESERNLLKLMDAYDSEVLVTDTALRKLFEEIQRLDDAGSTLWIVTSDHGEGLGNHQWLAHGKNIYNEQLKVLLIIYSSSGDFSGSRISQVVEHVDIWPSVAELAGLETAARAPGRFGKSVTAWLRGGEDGSGRYAFAQRRHYAPPSSEAGPQELRNYEPGETFALLDRDWKYIFRSEGPDELFNLATDPYETENLVGRGLDQEERLLSRLLSMIDHLMEHREAGEAGPRSVDPEIIERLRSLGYVQ